MASKRATLPLEERLVIQAELERLRATGRTDAQIADVVGCSGEAIRKARGHADIGYGVARDFYEAFQTRHAELAERHADVLRAVQRADTKSAIRVPHHGHAEPPDPPLASIIMAIDRLPRFRRWVEQHPELRLSEALRLIAAYDDAAPANETDWAPPDGWDAFSEDVLAGRLEPPPPTTKPYAPPRHGRRSRR